MTPTADTHSRVERLKHSIVAGICWNYTTTSDFTTSIHPERFKPNLAQLPRSDIQYIINVICLFNMPYLIDCVGIS